MLMPSTTDHISTADGTGVNVEMIEREHDAERDADDAADHRQRDRFGQHLRT